MSCADSTIIESCIDESLCIDSLQDLSVESLRSRTYQTTIKVEQILGAKDGLTPYSVHHSKDGSPAYSTYMLGYDSDGLQLYARVDIPVTSMPKSGFPVLVFAHGWVGLQKAPSYDFGYTPSSSYGNIIDTYVDAGYIVVSPGFRGHGVVNNKPAQGLEYMQAWDNGSYMMPIFYAVDLLNLVSGIDQLNTIDWGEAYQRSVRLNLEFVNLLGHSQGGDVALTALAISGENGLNKPHFKAASIWSGNIPGRFTQANTFGAMASTLQAFMSGDGTWTGSAKGKDGSTNSDFIFAWPADWIGTLNTDSEDWTWQSETWNSPSVEDAVTKKYQEMYDTLNNFVRDIDSATFKVNRPDSGKLNIVHSKEIEEKMAAIGGFNAVEYLMEPINLHFSDRDYYSFPEWNLGLTKRVNEAGGSITSFEYPGNTHSLTLSEYKWFSPEGSKAGVDQAIQRDLALFSERNPNPTLIAQ